MFCMIACVHVLISTRAYEPVYVERFVYIVTMASGDVAGPSGASAASSVEDQVVSNQYICS